jgi:hypothetical protein
MKRRGFIAGCGIVATTSAAGAAQFDPRAAWRRVGAGSAVGGSGGVTLGYVPGSAELAQGADAQRASPLRRNLWGRTTRAGIAVFGFMASDQPAFARIDLTVNFALAEPPYRAPFHAWQYVGTDGQTPRSSSPLRFTAGVPDGAEISIAFQLRNASTDARTEGVIACPVGGAGLGPGLYALAGPSPATGGAPDWNRLTWGEHPGLLERRDGQPIDFDYVTLLLDRPAA